MIVAGALIVLVAGAVVLAGAALTWAHATQRDDDGYFSTSSERLDTATPVIISDELDLGVSPSDTRWFDAGDLATVRIDVEGAGESPAFVGIGPAADVAAYLDGVAQAQIEDIEVDPFRVEYQFRTGPTRPIRPRTRTSGWLRAPTASRWSGTWRAATGSSSC